jgi:hypothetical protein
LCAMLIADLLSHHTFIQLVFNIFSSSNKSLVHNISLSCLSVVRYASAAVVEGNDNDVDEL